MNKSLMSLVWIFAIVVMLSSCKVSNLVESPVDDSNNKISGGGGGDKVQSSVKDIVEFSIDGRMAIMVGTDITLTMPYQTDLTNLTPLIVVPDGVTVSPASGVAQDFTNPVIYTATAEDGSTREYTVVVREAKSDEKAITGFAILEQEGVIDEKAKTILVTIPYGEELTNLTPVVAISGESFRIFRIKVENSLESSKKANNTNQI